MTLVQPWVLLGLVAVGLVALWALFRPGRSFLLVGSLSLWRRAVDSLPRSARRRSRRMSPAWAMLLAGAAAAVLAVARPAHFSGAPARRVAILLYPSAELGPDARWLRGPVAALLDRLDGHDRVRLYLPAAFGAADRWLSPREAKAEMDLVTVLPIRADRLVLPPVGQGVRHAYHFVPAGLDRAIASGPDTTVIGLATRLPAATLDAAGLEPLPDGNAQLFFAVRNHRPRPGRGRVQFMLGAGTDLTGARGTTPVSVEPGGRAAHALDVGRYNTIGVRLLDEKGEVLSGFGVGVWFTRRAGATRKVAMIGRDQPLLRRFVKADPLLQLVGDPQEADLVIASGQAAPSGRPALEINPPTGPAGWRRGEPRGPIRLAHSDVAADDPVMLDVALAGVAVRRAALWQPAENPSQKLLCGYKGDALILCTQPGEADGQRRIYVAFDLDAENTNFSMSEAFVIFLANSVRWLSPAAEGAAGRFELQGSLLPRQDSPARGASPLLGIRAHPGSAGGAYADGLLGLRGGQPRTSPAAAVAAAPLPAAESPAGAAEFWWIPALAAMALWLAGWALRTR